MTQIFLQRTHEPCALPALRLWFHDLQCGRARPGGYSAFPDKAVHLEVLDQVFDSEADAANYICEHNIRVRPAMAAQFRQLAELTFAELGERHAVLVAEASAVLHELQRFTQGVVRADAAALTESTLTCSGCGSAINRQAYLANSTRLMTDCPVCRANLLVTPAHVAARDALVARRREALARIESYKEQRRLELGKDKPQLMWLVAGWCTHRQAARRQIASVLPAAPDPQASLDSLAASAAPAGH